MKLPVYNANAKKTTDIEVPESVFKASFRSDLLHAAVVMQMRAQRQGTHSAKTRTEVNATGKKPFRQKGTGNARQGSLVGPHQEGGGVAFPPKPRSYETKLNKKQKREAIRAALTQKQYEENLVVLESLEIDSGKTRDAEKLLRLWSDRDVLMIGNFSETSLRALRNLSWCKVLPPEGVNVRDILKHKKVLLTKETVSWISEHFGVSGAERAA